MQFKIGYKGTTNFLYMQETNDFFSMAEFYSAMSESLITMRIAYITYLYVGDEGSRSSETTIGVNGKKIVLLAYTL